MAAPSKDSTHLEDRAVLGPDILKDTTLSSGAEVQASTTTGPVAAELVTELVKIQSRTTNMPGSLKPSMPIRTITYGLKS